jgi:outer membrane lipoprotein-sorting protein
MDNNRELFEGLLKADGIDPAGATESERAAFGKMLDEQSKLRQSRPSTARRYIWRVIMRSRITKLAAAAVIIIAAVLTMNIFHKPIHVISTASATELLTQAAKAVEDVRSIHIRARMRTRPGDNLGMIGLKYDFVPIEMWKKVNDAGVVLWRVEKPERVIVTNEESTIMLMGQSEAVKERPTRIGSFDTWYGHLMNVDEIIDYVLKGTVERENDQLCMYNEVLKEGTELVLETESAARGDFTNDWCRNSGIEESDHKEVYRFDAESKLLKSFAVYVYTDKEDVLVFEVTSIEYNPEIDDKLFTLELPEDVIWAVEPKDLGDKYQQMTPEEVARAFFQSCADENWDETLKFWPMSAVDNKLKDYLGGLEIISIGEPFKSGLYPGWFVPYEIRLRSGRIRNMNLAVRNDNPGGRYIVSGGF